MNINQVLGQLVKKGDQLSEQLSYLNDNEDHEARYWKQADDIYCEEESKTVKEIPQPRRVKHDLQAQAEDERGHSDKLKKNQEEMIDRQARMERHRVAVEKANLMKKAQEDEIAELRRKIADQQSSVERHQITFEKANLLKKAQENEIAELRRKIAAGEDNQRHTTIQAQSSKKKKSQRRQDEAEVEDERRGNFMPMVAEENTSEGEVKQPVRRSPKVMNTSKSSRREDMDDVRSLSSKLRTTRLTPSNTSLHAEETEEESPEEESTDEEAEYELPPSRRNPKVNRKPQSPSSASPRHDVDDQWRETNFKTSRRRGWGGRSNSLPTAPTYSQPHGAYLQPPMGHYVGAPGTTVNWGVGNTTNTTISNVGNNNSIEEVYCKCCYYTFMGPERQWLTWIPQILLALVASEELLDIN